MSRGELAGTVHLMTTVSPSLIGPAGSISSSGSLAQHPPTTNRQAHLIIYYTNYVQVNTKQVENRLDKETPID